MVVTLHDGSTAYYLRTWVGAMFWPISAFLFCVLVFIRISFHRRTSTGSASFLRWKPILAVAGFALIVSLIVSEMGGVSPFRRFYCVTVSEDAVELHCGLWSRRIIRSDVASTSLQVRKYDGRRQYRYPTLNIQDVSGRQWVSLEEQFVEGERDYLEYSNFIRNLRDRLLSSS